MSTAIKSFLLYFLVFSFLVLGFGMWEQFYSVKVSLSDMNAGISFTHPMGADQLGRDLLARFSMAVRQTIVPLWSCAFFGFLLGVLVSSSLYALEESKIGKLLNFTFTSVSSAVLALPFGVIVFAVSVYFEGISLKGVILSGFFYIFLKTILKLGRLVSESRHLGYWEAHESIGGSRFSRFFKYGVMTDFRDSLFSELVFNLKLLVAAEVTLSYLGFGVSEPKPSLGNILASNIENALKGEPRILLTSIAVLFLVMMVPSVLRGLVENYLSKKSI